MFQTVNMVCPLRYLAGPVQSGPQARCPLVLRTHSCITMLCPHPTWYLLFWPKKNRRRYKRGWRKGFQKFLLKNIEGVKVKLCLCKFYNVVFLYTEFCAKKNIIYGALASSPSLKVGGQ